MCKKPAPHMGLFCNHCGKNVFENPEDYFMLKDEVWRKICENNYVSWSDVMCKQCAEYWLGRKLVPEDYTDAPVNDFLKISLDDNQ